MSFNRKENVVQIRASTRNSEYFWRMWAVYLDTINADCVFPPRQRSHVETIKEEQGNEN